MKKLYLALTALIPLLNASSEIRLDRDIAVHLRLKRAISSETARVNERVEFEVTDDVITGGTVVITKGNLAWGRVVDAAPSGRLMRKGRLAIDIESVAASNGATVKLRATSTKQAGRTRDAASDTIGAFPALPFTMFQYGNEIEIPAGKLVTVYTASVLSVGMHAEAAASLSDKSSDKNMSRQMQKPQEPPPVSSSVLPSASGPPINVAAPVRAAVSRSAEPLSTGAVASVLPSTQPATTSTPAAVKNPGPPPEHITHVRLQSERPPATASTAKSKKFLAIVALGAAVGVAGVLAAKGHGGSTAAAATGPGLSTAPPATTVGIGGITVGGPH